MMPHQAVSSAMANRLIGSAYIGQSISVTLPEVAGILRPQYEIPIPERLSSPQPFLASLHQTVFSSSIAMAV